MYKDSEDALERPVEDGTRRIINRRRKKNGYGSAACNTQAQYPGSGW